MLLSGSALICLLAFSVPSTEAQVKFEASFFVHIYNYAGFQKLFNLAKGLNGDSNLAARKKRMQNWHKNNFGSMSTKSFADFDNKTLVLNKALKYLEFREGVSKFVKNCATPRLTKEYGANVAKKAINRFWMLDRMNQGVYQSASMMDSVLMLYNDVPVAKRNGMIDICFAMDDEALKDEKKGGLILRDYLPYELARYPYNGDIPSFGK